MLPFFGWQMCVTFVFGECEGERESVTENIVCACGRQTDDGNKENSI